eukprot:1682833-Pleurochrysis_carterae.AAC.1
MVQDERHHGVAVSISCEKACLGCASLPPPLLENSCQHFCAVEERAVPPRGFSSYLHPVHDVSREIALRSSRELHITGARGVSSELQSEPISLEVDA